MSAFTFSRAVSGSKVRTMYKRMFSSTAVKRKALDNRKRPSIDEVGIPAESWGSVYTKNQKKFNTQLLAGAGLLGVTVLVAYNAIDTNATPEYVGKSGFVTKLPEGNQQLSSGHGTTPSEYIAEAEETIKIIEVGDDDVKEAEDDVVKQTIESVDEVIEEVKKIETGFVTKLPEDQQLGTIPSQYSAKAEEAIKIIEVGLDDVKEDEDGVKQTIQSVDEVTEEVKQIKTGFINKHPEDQQLSSRLGTTPSEYIAKAEQEIKIIDMVVDGVKEAKDVIKQTIESVDEVTGFVTKLTEEDRQLSSGLGTTPTEYILEAKEAIKIIEVVVDGVKEAEDVVKQTIESVDEVIEEVKKIETGFINKHPEEDQLSSELRTTPSEYIPDAKEAEVVVDGVKEAEDVVKQTIESVDDVIEELKKIETGFINKHPEEDQQSSGLGTTPSEYIPDAKEAKVVVDGVKEAEDVVKQTVESVDEVIEEVKKIETGFVTKLPEEDQQLSSGLVTTPSEYIAKAEEAIKIIEVVVDDVVKKTVESVDEVIVEVKKIKDETKKIIQEGKEIASDSSKLASDIEEVVKDGAEIILDFKDVAEEIVENVLTEIFEEGKDIAGKEDDEVILDIKKPSEN